MSTTRPPGVPITPIRPLRHHFEYPEPYCVRCNTPYHLAFQIACFDPKGVHVELRPITITIRGPHDTGRTTVASFIKMFLEENGYRRVTVTDTEPLACEEKDRFFERLLRNKERPIKIVVELEEK